MSEQLAVLALRHAVPAIYEFRAFAAAGSCSAIAAATEAGRRSTAPNQVT